MTPMLDPSLLKFQSREKSVVLCGWINNTSNLSTDVWRDIGEITAQNHVRFPITLHRCIFLCLSAQKVYLTKVIDSSISHILYCNLCRVPCFLRDWNHMEHTVNQVWDEYGLHSFLLERNDILWFWDLANVFVQSDLQDKL